MPEPWLQLGPHRYRVSGDLFEWEPHGVLELRYGEQMIKLQTELQAKCSYLAVLVDGRDLRPLPAAVRTLYVSALREMAGAATMVVVFGAGWMTQVTQTLALRAAGRLSSIRITLRHVDTQEQGISALRQLISEHQAVLKRSNS